MASRTGGHAGSRLPRPQPAEITRVPGGPSVAIGPPVLRSLACLLLAATLAACAGDDDATDATDLPLGDVSADDMKADGTLGLRAHLQAGPGPAARSRSPQITSRSTA